MDDWLLDRRQCERSPGERSDTRGLV